MILLEVIVQILRGSVQTTAAKNSFLMSGRPTRRSGLNLITRGYGWGGLLSFLQDGCLAASALRSAEDRKSIVALAESMARYR